MRENDGDKMHSKACWFSSGKAIISGGYIAKGVQNYIFKKAQINSNKF